MKLIGIDFSITKTGVCVWDSTTDKYSFFGFPRPDHISPARKQIFRDHGVTIVDRRDLKNSHTDSSDKMRFAVDNARYLADQIVWALEEDLVPETYIAFEGMSFGSTGDAVLQLSGYKYLLMHQLSSYVPLERMYTYAPQTIKKTAGCSVKILDPITGKKRTQGKPDMIRAFEKEPTEFSKKVRENPDLFMKKGHKSYIELLDDLVDSYWVIQTHKEKQAL